jgi:hypothetical protein
MNARQGKLNHDIMEELFQTLYVDAQDVAKQAHLVQAYEQAADTIMDYVQTKMIERALQQ